MISALMDGGAQGMFTTTAPSVPWYVMLGLILMPGIVAIFMTIASITAWRRANRTDGNPPIRARKVMIVTIIVGAFWGVSSQLGLQGLVELLTGVHPMYELAWYGAAFTGIASMATYELLKWYAKKKRWKGIYELIAVKHGE